MLKDLQDLGRTLEKQFVSSFKYSDYELPNFFKVAYKELISENKFGLGYEFVKFYRYSTVITTSTKKIISIPNFWFVAANCFVPYAIELVKYKSIVNSLKIELNESSSWPKELKDTNSLPFNKNSYKVTQNLSQKEFDFLTLFITDYGWWRGGKTIDRGDYYVSPILKLGNFLAESQSAISEITWQISKMEDDDISKRLSKEYIQATSTSRSINQIDFDIKKFHSALVNSNLYITDAFPFRFTSSLLTKPFVILTGLSGSGKTKLAEAFAFWITCNNTRKATFRNNQKIAAMQAKYIVEDTDRLGVILKSEGSTKTFLPYELIESWADTIISEGLTENTSSQEIQKKVFDCGIEYSKTLNSFHSPLKALAFEFLKQRNNNDNISINQTCMVSVGADWTNREPLLGFPNALEKGQYVKPDSGALDLLINAEKDPNNPYFLILDEMNMSHVERYFADFLSAMESVSGEIALHPDTVDWEGCDVPAKISLPKNLFIIGTVNIDETTYMFSPKVLDRASVIEFRVSENEMGNYFKQPTELNLASLKGAGASMAESFVAKSYEKGLMTQDLDIELMPFFTNLKAVGAEFGYRTASEISRFVKICEDMNGGTMKRDEIVDAAIIQKLLPKLHGSRSKIEKVLDVLIKLCMNGENVKYTLSHEKLTRMKKRVMADGFTSFAEA